jgi:hypothetical protein
MNPRLCVSLVANSFQVGTVFNGEEFLRQTLQEEENVKLAPYVRFEGAARSRL